MGETHVPPKKNGKTHRLFKTIHNLFGETGFVWYYIISTLFFGWYAYLFFGATGSPKRGFTSHFFVPNKLFPMNSTKKVVHYIISMAGLGGMFYVLFGTFYLDGDIFALYFGPYIFTNVWLVLYTYLQHTDSNIPYYRDINWFEGNLCTVDRAYCHLINWLHFDIGRYHVAHHLFPNLPHFQQAKVTMFLKQKLETGFDQKYTYRFSDASIPHELAHLARNCNIIEQSKEDPNRYQFTSVVKAKTE
jgi:omega-6 fatty acid desaturase (delta-12 desaturase)